MSVINESIKNRKLFTGFDESTYYRKSLYDMVADNADDPLILFKVKIFGFYKYRYRWTNKDCQKFFDSHKENALGHEVNGVWYYYDWGSGENKVTNDAMHEPTLDHILPREQGGTDAPENLRIRCRRLNSNKSNTNTDQERYATIMDMFHDIEDHELKRRLVEYLREMVDLN